MIEKGGRKRERERGRNSFLLFLLCVPWFARIDGRDFIGGNFEGFGGDSVGFEGRGAAV